MHHEHIDLIQVADLQNDIIKMQSDVIDKLYRQLCQILPASALDVLPLYTMQTAADERKKLETEYGG